MLFRSATDFFLYENNKSASKEIKEQIAKELGVGIDPSAKFTYINSALVSAQNRQRFYVTNFGEIEQPVDRAILLKDVLETNGENVSEKEKSYCLTATYNGATLSNTLDRKQRTMVAEPVIYQRPHGKYGESGSVAIYQENNKLKILVDFHVHSEFSPD